jgi:hypothetical protein
MDNISYSSYYTIQDHGTDLFYTAVYGDASTRLEPVQTLEQSRNSRQSWVKLRKTEGGIYIMWNTVTLTQHFRTTTDNLLLHVIGDGSEWVTLAEPESGSVSPKIRFVEIPAKTVDTVKAGFVTSDEFPTPVKMTIDESRGISIFEDKLFPGIPVPVTIKTRNNVSTINFGGKYLTLQFTMETTFADMKAISKTINYNTSGSDITQYILTDQVQEQGPYSSSLFRIIEVELDSVYRIENFHFPGSYMNISDDNIFFPSILTGSTSEIEIISEQVQEEIDTDAPVEGIPETQQLYIDLGLDPETVLKARSLEQPPVRSLEQPPARSLEKPPARSLEKPPVRSLVREDNTKIYIIVGLNIMLLFILAI